MSDNRSPGTFRFLAILLLIAALTACQSAKKDDTTDTLQITAPQESLTDQQLAEPLTEAEERGETDAVSGALAFAPTMAAVAPLQRQVSQTTTVPGGGIPPTPSAMQFDNPGTNPFLDTQDDNLSTFAMDVDTGSYTIARSYLTGQNQLPPEDAIRPEEFINYFDAGYDSPGGNHAFAIYLVATPAPFGYTGHYLMRVGIQGKYIAPEDRAPVFLIFVIDVSGSMDMENRLGLVKESLELLTGELREDDRVGVVVYSDRSRAVLDPTPASETDTIMQAINALQPEGSTNVEDGLRLGYAMAQEHKRDGENTRVIVLSDGVANVGNTGPDAILQTIRAGVEDGITLSMIGFGMGNYNDVLMERLANDGNGNYYYVDTLREARRVFVHNLTSTLRVIGYDAKVQVEFNPDVTDRYRLIGYENRAIADEDFRNDTVDAGEVGAGHSITALYELALQDNLECGGCVVATVRIRYEDADTREVVEIEQSITTDDLLASIDDAPASFRLQAGAAEFAELLRRSFWSEGGTYGAVLDLIEPIQAELPEDEDVTELIALVERAIEYADR